MRNRKLFKADIECFREHLCQEEKSAATVEKYIRDTHAFYLFGRSVNYERKGNEIQARACRKGLRCAQYQFHAGVHQ